jgi:hypothetical protein
LDIEEPNLLVYHFHFGLSIAHNVCQRGAFSGLVQICWWTLGTDYNEEWLRKPLEDKMTATQSFDGYVRGKLSLFKALIAKGHHNTDLGLRCSLMNSLPEEMGP